MQLNPKQLEARNKVNGPLLIIAGAGSGKTASLAARVEYMINEKGINPNNIMMVTFTNKAANEMRQRVANVLNQEKPKNIYDSYNFPLIGTFHSIGIFILKQSLNTFLSEELDIGLKKDFVIYDEQDKISIIKNIIKNKLFLDEKDYPAKKISTYISNAKNYMLTAKLYENEVDSHFKEIVYKVFLDYEKSLNNNNAIDFDDILNKTYFLLLKPKVLENYQEKYKYIMVDEYQDTNLVQYSIINLLASKYKNLAVVGDDSQSIYSWRGADMRNIINFKKDYPEAHIIKLEQNYRSTKTIISSANSLIANNNSGIKKELWTDNIEGELIQYIEAPDEKLEAKIIANIIKEKYNSEQNYLYKDNLILYRTNAQSRRLEEALINQNIPYKVVGGLKFYDRAEIKDLLAYLKVIYNPEDIVSMKRIINKPSRKIGDKTISTLDEIRENYSLNYLQIFENIDEIDELGSGTKNAIKSFYEIYKTLKKSSLVLDVADLIKEIIKITSYVDFITQSLSEEEKLSKEDNIGELINLATEYNGMGHRESLELFLEDISLITDMDLKDERSDYVTLMTMHTSKGLEEKRVFITGLEEGLFPNIRSISEQSFLEEERRLMYVAMTRAKEELYLSRALERFYFGEFLKNGESRFIKEISKENIIYYDLGEYKREALNYFSNYSFNNDRYLDNTNISYRAKVNIQNNDISQFKIGDRLLHPKFSEGIITKLDGELASIAFGSYGIKKLNIKIAPIKKM